MHIDLHPPAKKRPLLSLGEGVNLARARVHEVTGPARRSFAVMIAGAMKGPVLWIMPVWESDRPNPDGLRPFFEPSRLILALPRRPEDYLWCLEQGLRSGAALTVIADLPRPPGLTPVRRLMLAAEESGHSPIGILLTPGDGGAPGIETRWYIEQRHVQGKAFWSLERLRARVDPPRRWRVRYSQGGLHFDPAAGRPLP